MSPASPTFGTVPNDSDYRELALSNGGVALVDAADFEWLSQWSWRRGRGGGNSFYAVRNEVVDGQPRTVSMHREILGRDDPREVDHRNCRGLDNRRTNLRFCSRAENMRNRNYSRPSAAYKGVHKKGGSWRAKVVADGATHYLGTFATETGAALAYDTAAIALHGDFARPNFAVHRDWIVPDGLPCSWPPAAVEHTSFAPRKRP